MLKMATIIGARPQFIKASTVSRVISDHNAHISTDQQLTNNSLQITEFIIHTGQHFDDNMSQVFFDELEIPKPDYHLGISGGGHGTMTGAMLQELEPLLQEIQPDWVLVYGDTNSTLAGALAASKLHVPVAHVEAGLRSYNRGMPEEINRILADQLSNILFCPTESAVENLQREGFPHQLTADNKQLITNVGDVMFDAALFYGEKAEKHSRVLADHGLERGGYVLATVHRQENTEDPDRLKTIFEALREVARKMPLILPLHPRTRKQLKLFVPQLVAHSSSLITLIDPVGYLDMCALEKNAAVITTDSGGVQKEAYFHGVPCVTMREETEWIELVEAGWNRLAPPSTADIVEVILGAVGSRGAEGRPYGNGDAAERIVKSIRS